MGDQPCPLGSRDPKSHLRKVLKELSLLRLLKRTNRRILRLHAVAVQCWHSLTAQRLPGLLPVPPRMCHVTPKPQEVTEEAVGSPATDATSSKDPETGTPLGDPQPLAKNWGAGEAKKDMLGTLPQRFHLPAPKVLCRPSAQRWVKPCCTRSCGESLEQVLTIRYPQ
ncbi:TP53-target gene 5 protein [Anser cygnoides]|uniref:TP53-target gene 5 protein n=1 Tax=Anser cygnoides TaxID=8845 RepID=UPI0034D29E77